MTGARGPISMPDNVRQLRGNPGRRQTPPSSAGQFVSAVPNPPTTLSAEAKAEWRRITPELSRTKVVAMLDRALLATYCETWASLAQLRKAKSAAAKAATRLSDPLEILAAADTLTKIEGAINAKIRLVLPMQKELLLTPVSRLRTPPPKTDDGPAEEDLD